MLEFVTLLLVVVEIVAYWYLQDDHGLDIGGNIDGVFGRWVLPRS